MGGEKLNEKSLFIYLLVLLLIITGCSNGNVTINVKDKDNVIEDKNQNPSVSLICDGVETSIDLSNNKNGDVIKLDKPEKENYTFVGWFDNEDFNGKRYSSLVYKDDLNIKLYAKFEINTLREINSSNYNFNGKKIGIMIDDDSLYNPYSPSYIFDDKLYKMDQIELINELYNCEICFVEKRLEYDFYYVYLYNLVLYAENNNMSFEEAYNFSLENATYVDDDWYKNCVAYEDIYLNNVVLYYGLMDDLTANFKTKYDYEYLFFDNDLIELDHNFDYSVTTNYKYPLEYYKESYMGYLVEEINSLEVLSYPKELFEELNLKTPLTLYNEGAWTVDVFFEYCKILKEKQYYFNSKKTINEINIQSFLKNIGASLDMPIYTMEKNEYVSNLGNLPIANVTSGFMDLVNDSFITMISGTSTSCYNRGFASTNLYQYYNYLNYIKTNDETNIKNEHYIFSLEVVPYPTLDGSSSSNMPATYLGYRYFDFYDVKDEVIDQEELISLINDLENAFTKNETFSSKLYDYLLDNDKVGDIFNDLEEVSLVYDALNNLEYYINYIELKGFVVDYYDVFKPEYNYDIKDELNNYLDIDKYVIEKIKCGWLPLGD